MVRKVINCDLDTYKMGLLFTFYHLAKGGDLVSGQPWHCSVLWYRLPQRQGGGGPSVDCQCDGLCSVCQGLSHTGKLVFFLNIHMQFCIDTLQLRHLGSVDYIKSDECLRVCTYSLTEKWRPLWAQSAGCCVGEVWPWPTTLAAVLDWGVWP